MRNVQVAACLGRQQTAATKKVALQEACEAQKAKKECKKTRKESSGEAKENGKRQCRRLQSCINEGKIDF